MMRVHVSADDWVKLFFDKSERIVDVSVAPEKVFIEITNALNGAVGYNRTRHPYGRIIRNRFTVLLFHETPEPLNLTIRPVSYTHLTLPTKA